MNTLTGDQESHRGRAILALVFFIGSVIGAIVAIVAIVAITAFSNQATEGTSSPHQISKVEQATSLLESVGFENPTYAGITPGIEGEYPTFQATAIGGEQVLLWIRTTPNGGMEIQPTMLFETVESADDFARIAQKAVNDNESNAGRLAPYNPPSSYWVWTSQTAGWPRE